MNILKYITLGLALAANFSNSYAGKEDFSKCGIMLKIKPKMQEIQIHRFPIEEETIMSPSYLTDLINSHVNLKMNISKMKIFCVEDIYEAFQYIYSNKGDLAENLRQSKHDKNSFFEMTVISATPNIKPFSTTLSFFLLEKQAPQNVLQEEIKVGKL